MNLERLRQRFFEGLTRYRWQETVGRGGMGIVFKAQDLDLDDVVAIKVLSPDWETDDQQLLLRFKREINLNRKIKHPNVARIHDFGMSNDFPYITMEYVPGQDLRTVIQLEGKLPQARAISILRQIALGTEAAHKLGIIHRDLKSQNVMLEENGAVAILDFGLARGKTNEQLTLDSVMVGTPHYMSPEQALGRPTDARSDVYSIGVMAYELLTGKVPFDGESPLVIAMKHVSEQPPDGLRQVTTVSPELVAIVYKALAKEPAQRFATAADLEAELAMLHPFESGQVPAVSGPHVSVEAAASPSAPGAPIQSLAGRGTHPELGSMATPVMPTPALPVGTSATPPIEIKARPPVILLVEVDAKERKRLADVLGRHGCRALEAKDGPEALQRLLQDTVDLVLMDVALPGMDGFDVTRVIKAQASSTALPVVLTSARLDRSHFAFAIQTGATDVLAKPLQSEAVIGRLWHILTHHGFQPPPGNEPVIAAMRKTLPSAMTPPSGPGKSGVR
ncbi:MAG: serine/threonine-protein kinase [Thermoanaerobaculia bacterium]|nr:serine/threonine-protein kinase [Thermoanaerobaculia bacterium]